MEADLMADVVRIQPVLTTTVYSQGDNIGGLLSSTKFVEETTGTSTLLDITVIDRANRKVAIDVLFYSQNPVNSTITDNAALAISGADHANYFLGRISIAAADYATQAAATGLADCTKTAAFCGLKLRSTGGDGKIYVVLLATAAASGAFAAGAQDLTFVFGIDQD